VRAQTLAVVVSAPTDVDAALAVAAAARDSNVEVGLFFMADAVGALPAARDRLSALAEADCDLIACAHSAHERGLCEADVGMLLGSQDDHAALIHRAHRTLAFT